MNFSKKTKFTLLLLLMVLNIVFRLPPTIHETGVDSFFIHNLATSISTYGYAGWIIHPVSFTGMYPLSYASAFPFLISGVSQVTDLSTELIILFFCILLAIFGILSIFLFAKEVKNDDLFAFLVAVVFSLSPNFLRFTMWTGTTRILFVVFFPLFLWALLRFRNSFSGKDVGIALFLFVLLLVSHNLVLFLPIILIAFVVTVFLILVYQKGHGKIMSKFSIIIFPVAFLVMFLIQFSGIGFYEKLLPEFYTGYLFQGTDTYTILLNIAADYFGKVGVILLFGLIGFVSLSRTVFSSFGKTFVMISVLMLTPLLVIEDYTPVFILPFLSLLVGFGLIYYYDLINKRKMVFKRAFFSILAICIIITTGFSIHMLDHWQVYASSMSDETYATASFLGSDKANGTSVANSGLLSSQISAFSGKGSLPYGGAYAQRNSPEQLIYGTVNADEVVARPLSLSEILSERTLYVSSIYIPDSKKDWTNLMGAYYSNEQLLVAEKYDLNYVVEDTKYSGNYWHWKTYYSRLLKSLHSSGNKIYDVGKENIWYII